MTNQADSNDKVNVTPNDKVTLKVGATYKISTDMELTDVTVNDKETIEVTEDTTELTISLDSTLATTTITVKDADNLLGDGTVTLTNIKDAADVHSFKSQDVVPLKSGEVHRKHLLKGRLHS